MISIRISSYTSNLQMDWNVFLKSNLLQEVNVQKKIKYSWAVFILCIPLVVQISKLSCGQMF